MEMPGLFLFMGWCAERRRSGLTPGPGRAQAALLSEPEGLGETSVAKQKEQRRHLNLGIRVTLELPDETWSCFPNSCSMSCLISIPPQ